MGLNSGKEQSVENKIADIPVDVISITEDSLKIILLQHIQKIGKKKDIKSYVSLFFAFLITFVTTDFHDFIVKADTWYGIFIVLTLISFYFLVKVFKENQKIDNENVVDNLLIEISKSRSHIKYACFIKYPKIDKIIDSINSEPLKGKQAPEHIIHNLVKKSKRIKRKRKNSH